MSQKYTNRQAGNRAGYRYNCELCLDNEAEVYTIRLLWRVGWALFISFRERLWLG